MKRIRSDLITLAVVQLLAVAVGTMALLIGIKWSLNTRESQAMLASSKIVLETLASGAQVANEAEDLQELSHALSEFGRTATSSLENEYAATQSFLGSIRSALYAMIGAGLIGAFLCGRTLLAVRKVG